MALKIVRHHGNVLRMRGTVQLPNGQKKRIERTTGTEDIEIALTRMREYERELFGLMPRVDTLRMALEMIVLLAESGRTHELPRILSVAEKALSLLPKASDQHERATRYHHLGDARCRNQSLGRFARLQVLDVRLSRRTLG